MNYIEEYKKRLEDIEEKIGNVESLRETKSDRMLLLSYILDVYDSKIYFDNEKVKREASICVEYLYKRFDYDEWIERNWSESFQRYKEKQTSNILTNQGWNQALDYDSDSQKYAASVVGYMPNNNTKDFDEAASRESFRSALQYLCGPYLNIENLKFALFAALKDLLESLSNLKKVKNKTRTSADFVDLDNWLYFQFISSKAKVIAEEYEDAKSRVTGGVTYEWLVNYLKDELVRLSKTTFMAKKIKDYNGGEHGESSECINLDGIKQPKKFIAALLDLCSYKDGTFIFDKNENVGRFIYNYHDQLEENAHLDFYRFKYIAELVSKDLKKYKNKNKKSTVVVSKKTFKDYISLRYQSPNSTAFDNICSLISEQRWTAKDKARFALKIYESSIMVPRMKPNTFKEWYNIFCSLFAITPGNYEPNKLTDNKATRQIEIYLE